MWLYFFFNKLEVKFRVIKEGGVRFGRGMWLERKLEIDFFLIRVNERWVEKCVWGIGKKVLVCLGIEVCFLRYFILECGRIGVEIWCFFVFLFEVGILKVLRLFLDKGYLEEN